MIGTVDKPKPIGTCSSKPWRVGIAADPLPEDRRYDDEREAIEAAARMVEAQGWNVAVAVWDERDDPVWLFMLGEQFKRM
jgi:hypothetical protein